MRGRGDRSVAEVVLEVVALGLQGVDIFVLDLPARTGRLHQLFDVFLADQVTADAGGVEGLLPSSPLMVNSTQLTLRLSSEFRSRTPLAQR